MVIYVLPIEFCWSCETSSAVDNKRINRISLLFLIKFHHFDHSRCEAIERNDTKDKETISGRLIRHFYNILIVKWRRTARKMLIKRWRWLVVIVYTRHILLIFSLTLSTRPHRTQKANAVCVPTHWASKRDRTFRRAIESYAGTEWGTEFSFRIESSLSFDSRFNDNRLCFQLVNLLADNDVWNSKCRRRFSFPKRPRNIWPTANRSEQISVAFLLFVVVPPTNERTIHELNDWKTNRN